MATTQKSGLKVRSVTSAQVKPHVRPRTGKYDDVVALIDELPLTKKNTLLLDLPKGVETVDIFRRRMSLLVMKRARDDREFRVFKTEDGKVAIQRVA